MPRIGARALRTLCTSLAMRYGAPERAATVLAESLVDANLKGIDTHGISRLPIYLKRVNKGLIDPGAKMEFDQSFPAAGILDANNGFGQVAGSKGMEHAVALAKTEGVGAVGIRNSQHFGAAGYYCENAVNEGYVGLTLTNSESAMPPSGGYEAFFGTNPIALGVPTGREPPILIDLSTSIVARGQIIAAAQREDSIPEGWAVDAEGNATTDPEEALEGAVLPMAGAKGYALALLVDLLSGVLSGAGFGDRVGSMYEDFTRSANVGHFVLALNVDAFLDEDEFFERIDALRKNVKSLDTRPDAEDILLPGERRHRVREERKENGIPLDEEIIERLDMLADEVDLPLPAPIRPES